MPTAEPGRPKNPGAFRRSVSDQLKNRRNAPGTSTTLQNLIRRFLQERLLARVFADPESPWALKGGLSMLVRVPPLARYSRDVDLVHLPGDPEQAAEDLRRLLAAPADDPLRFQIREIRPVSSDAAPNPAEPVKQQADPRPGRPDLLLIESAPGRLFYEGDLPVVPGWWSAINRFGWCVLYVGNHIGRADGSGVDLHTPRAAAAAGTLVGARIRLTRVLDGPL